MDLSLFQAVFLGFIQGLTEFLPVSSSGHLFLAEHLLNLPAADLLPFDIVVHVATFLALALYFWSDWRSILHFKSLRDWRSSRLLLLIIATLPAVIAALTLEELLTDTLRNTASVSLALAFTATLLLLSELLSRSQKRHSTPTPLRALLIGFSQALAIIPGISRSGSTIATGLLTGLDRSAAAVFSFQMLNIALLGATLLLGFDLLQGAITLPPLPQLLAGFTASLCSSLLFIHLMIRLVRRISLAWFSIYLYLIASLTFLFLR